ncbi:anhydro-N-acetylmuramic acid kinase [Anthocerotibacter panamensis]|uniref:anhydro-N-acetylmuramic acid kinase n=1 Tax=Anthocerotibacter panamensis TaxID=2857077 RepID=UPI001C4024EB|nr:anhydro-N-acetylmuramic acid kinase [Anthocerotibacter panamensis]
MIQRAVGLMSGTSVDGIDAALVEIQGTGYDLSVKTLATQHVPYPQGLQQQVLALGEGAVLSALALGALHRDLGELFGRAAQDLIAAQGLCAQDITVIGSHGQTVAHRPPQGGQRGYSVQLGDGAVIAEVTGVPTVSNFRARDLAAGGQGAPLVPWVDWILCRHPQENRAIQNIGGIGNVTYLPAGGAPQTVLAFDTGPGNMLLDRIVRLFSSAERSYDAGGALARTGAVHRELLEKLLCHPYLREPPPKSTGREAFGLVYLTHWLEAYPHLKEADLLATFVEFTSRTIVDSYHAFLPHLPDSLWLGGGGVHNTYLVARLKALLPGVRVASTADLGLDPDYKEAIAFAVLAYLRLRGLPGNLPQVTHAHAPVLLGEIHPL